MTKIIYNTATAFTGHIADEYNSLDWLFAVEQSADTGWDTFMSSVGVIVQGSTTYEWVLEHEELMHRPDKWKASFGDRPVYVFTHRDLPVPKGADVRLVHGQVASVLDEIRAAAAGRDIWVAGGGDLAGQFADADALDRIILTIAPVALPAGAPVFPRRLESSRLRLHAAKRQGQFVTLTYDVLHRAGAPPDG